MPYLALALVAVVVLVMLARWFVAANPAALAQGLRWAGIGVAALGVGALLLRGQVWLAGFLLPILVGLWQGRRPSWFGGGGASTAGPTPGQASSIRTDFLELTLDHDTGALSGDVLRGHYRNRRIETLSQAELLALRQETVAADPASTPLVETVLDRAFPDWRDAAEAATPGTGAAAAPRAGAMTREEALRILGLSGDPSPDAVAEAHRRLMMAHHPDRGGSAYLAALINEAKSVLTGSR